MNRNLMAFLGILALAAPAFAESTARILVRVIDDAGVVVTGAPVSISTFSRHIPGPDFGTDARIKEEALTDTNGTAALQIRCKNGRIRYKVSAPNDPPENQTYARFNGKLWYRDVSDEISFEREERGRWIPWEMKLERVVRPVINPVPMYVRRLGAGRFLLPATNEVVKFDLMKSDWLSPHGEGETADVLYFLENEFGDMLPSRVRAHKAKLTMTFSNPGDGLIEYRDDPRTGSVFRSPRLAPESGYTNDWTTETFESLGEMSPLLPLDQNYVLRVRTVTNAAGEIVSAHYGKISGPMQMEVRGKGAGVDLYYYLNPTPNDRNLEFAIGQNLLKGDDPVEFNILEP